MYTVEMEHKCNCFNKSEYEDSKSFDTHKDAYNYSKMLAELMNEDFCTKHLFVAQRVGDSEFLIRVSANKNASISCDTGPNSTDDVSVGVSMYSDDNSCGSGCGCK